MSGTDRTDRSRCLSAVAARTVRTRCTHPRTSVATTRVRYLWFNVLVLYRIGQGCGTKGGGYDMAGTEKMEIIVINCIISLKLRNLIIDLFQVVHARMLSSASLQEPLLQRSSEVCDIPII